MRRDRSAVPSPLALLALIALISSFLFAGAVGAADGAPDNTFSSDGVQIIGWGNGADSAVATAVVGLADGSLIVGGTVRDTGTDRDFGLVKLTVAGDVDISWGAFGRRVIPIDAAPDANDDSLQDIAILADGSFLVAGWNFSDSSAANPRAAVAKLTPQGDLDESFGDTGVAIVEVPFSAGYFVLNQVLHQPDGKTLYLGDCESCPDFLPRARPFVLRLTTAGTPDTSFSGDGVMLAQSPPWSESWAEAMALDGAGRILVLSDDNDQLLVARLTPTGQLDTSFGGGLGYVSVPRPTGSENPYQLAVDGATGTTGASGASGGMFISYPIRSGPNTGFTGVLRLDRNGALDPTYGGDGEAELTYEDSFTIAAMHLQGDGKLVLAGSTTHLSPTDRDPILFRLLPNGSPDASFDGNGMVVLDFHQSPGSDEDAREFAFAGGRPVAVGSVQVNGLSRFGISRLKSTLVFTDGFEVGTAGGWLGN